MIDNLRDKEKDSFKTKSFLYIIYRGVENVSS